MCRNTRPHAEPSFGVPAALAAGLALASAASAAVINVPADQPTVQDAIDVAVNGDEIIVATGTYTENIDLGGKAITVRSTDPEDPAVVIATVLDGGGAGSVITCDDGEDGSTVITGFLITGGAADFGGGVMCVNSSPTISNATICANTAINDGGGIFNNGGAPRISNCMLQGNGAGFGGGLANRNGGAAIVTNCIFSANTAEVQGGGMISQTSNAIVTDCVFEANTADDRGGGIFSFFSEPEITGCTISGNTATIEGGGIFTFGLNPSITGTFVCGNGPEQISGVFSDDGANVVGLHCPPPGVVECDPVANNDACADAIQITGGDTLFDNSEATTDGPELPGECDEGSGLGLGADIWYRYTPECSGTLTVSTCDNADFDTRLAIYTGGCDELEFVACNDDGAKCADGTSELTIPIVNGQTVLIRLGGVDDGKSVARGTGILSVICDGRLRPADIDNDGDVDFNDLLILLADFDPT